MSRFTIYIHKWMRTAVACLAGALVFATAGTATIADTSDPAIAIDGIAAYVNGDTVTVSDVNKGVWGFLRDREWLAGRHPREAYPAAFEEALQSLVNHRLILQEYEGGKLRLPPWLFEQRQREIIDERYQGDTAALMRDLASERLTLEEWRNLIKERTIVSAMRHSKVDSNVKVAPGRIVEYYNSHAEEFTDGGGVRLGLMLLKQNGGESDEDFLKRAARVAAAASGSDKAFSAAAREFSQDSRASEGGDWGWLIPEDMLRTELVTALRGLTAGETSAPVQTSTGIYILRKIEERESAVQPLADVREKIENTLRLEETERLFEAWTRRLRSKASIILTPLAEKSVIGSVHH